MLLCAVYSWGAQPSSIDDIEVRAQSRGIVLIISGSGPINISGKPDELEKMTSKYSEVRISIKNARSGLGERSFSGPAELPIREISLKESNNGVDVSIRMRGVMNGPVQIRSGDNQIRILLTRDEFPQVNWNASTGKTVSAPRAASAPAPAKAVLAAESKPSEAAPAPSAVQNRAAAAPAVSAAPASDVMNVTIPSDKPRDLNNIRVLQRDRTVSLNFDFSDEPVASMDRAGDSLVIRFSNTVSKIGSRVFNVPGNTVYSSVRIRQERAADRSSSVVAVVKLNRNFALVTPVSMRLDNQYSLYAESGDSARVFIWSANEGVKSNVAFTKIKAEPVDMQKMENRAHRDIEKGSGGALFPVTAGGTAAAGAASPSIAPAQPQAASPRRSEVPEPSFQNVFDDESVPASDVTVTKESADGDLVRYRVYGRDPFVPLVRDPGLTGLPKVENLRLVGVLEDSRERIALLEDFTDQNRAFAMRTDDMVEYGRVLRIHRDRVVFLMSDFGVARSYTLRIARNTQ
ncbi:MAG: hypothetical protein FWE57_05700 [Chitinispirillia bacterium]|nr:hypothetical protein [Chitinispirillia bacterium]